MTPTTTPHRQPKHLARPLHGTTLGYGSAGAIGATDMTTKLFMNQLYTHTNCTTYGNHVLLETNFF